MNSSSSSSLSQRGIRSDSKVSIKRLHIQIQINIVSSQQRAPLLTNWLQCYLLLLQSNHQSLSSSTTSLSTSNLPSSSSSSLTPASSDPKITDEAQISTLIATLVKKLQQDQLGLDRMEPARKIEDIHESHRQTAVRELHNKAVDMSGSTESKLCFIGHICNYWLKQKLIVKQDYVQGVSEFLNIIADIEMDVPKIFEWTVQMICKLSTIFFYYILFILHKHSLDFSSQQLFKLVLFWFICFDL